jgi:hypothetical protein
MSTDCFNREPHKIHELASKDDFACLAYFAVLPISCLLPSKFQRFSFLAFQYHEREIQAGKTMTSAPAAARPST